MKKIILIEDHHEALDVWRKKKFKDSLLVHLDAHIDFSFFRAKPTLQIAKEAKTIKDLKSQLEKALFYMIYENNLEAQLNIGNYIYPAIRDGLVSRFCWVVPGRRKQFKSCLNSARRFVKKIKSQDPRGNKDIKISGNKVFMRLYGKDFEIKNIFSIPRTKKPILLDVDVDFLLFDSINNLSLTKNLGRRRPWIYPKELTRLIKRRFPYVACTTIAYSVNGGFTPIGYKFFGDEISMRLKGPISRELEDIVFLRNKGIDEFFAGNLNTSAEKFEKAVRKLKDCKNLDTNFKQHFFAHLFFWLFKICWELKEKEKAREYYQKMLKKDPAYRIKENSLGPFYLGKNDLKLARREFEKILYCDGNDPFSLCGLGEIFFRCKRYKKALEKYKQALSLNLRQKEALFGAARSQIQLNKLNQAKKSVLSLKRIAPSGSSVFLLDANLNKRLGNIEKALASYKEAIMSGGAGIKTYEEVFAILKTKKNNSLFKFFKQRYRGFKNSFYKNQKKMLSRKTTKNQAMETDKRFKRIDKTFGRPPARTQIFLEIAGVKIRARSKKEPIEEDETSRMQFESFFKETSDKRFDIDLEVEAPKRLPEIENKETIFMVKRDKGEADWVLSKKNKEFIIEAKRGEMYTAIFNENFTKGKIYLKDSDGISGWRKTQLVYGPSQIMLINYLAKHKLGVLVHSMGIDYKGKGLLFIGPTQSGKSTSARLWNKKQGVSMLNDDRIIIRKIKGDIYMFGTPWHGDFSNYADTISGSVPLKKLFFIYHKKENKASPLKPQEAFNRFFTNTFPVLWDKEDMDFTTDFLTKCLRKVPAHRLGFVDNESAVSYVCNHTSVL